MLLCHVYKHKTMTLDPYNVLGVDRSASQDDIKKAFRKKAHLYHPDKKGGDEARFKEVNEAYQILGNTERKQRYDRFGTTDTNGSHGGGGYQDFGQGFGNMGGFESIFDMFGGFDSGAQNRVMRGEDLHLNIRASKSDVGKRKIFEYEAFDPCGTCDSTGTAPGSKRVTCSQCQGQGRVRQSVRTPFGTFAHVTPCGACEGEGKRPEKTCDQCGGTGRVKMSRKIAVELPRDIGDRYQMAFPKGGNAGPRGAARGDLTISVSVD